MFERERKEGKEMKCTHDTPLPIGRRLFREEHWDGEYVDIFERCSEISTEGF